MNNPADKDAGGIAIPYSIRDVDYAGKGIFAEATISPGTLVWAYRVGENVTEFDGPAAAAHLEKLTMGEAKIFLDATYGRGDKLCLITDDGKYMNHSTDPNCLTDMETGNTFAVKDIKEGEQLFEDYRRFEHPVFLFPLLAKYECAPDYYDLPSEVQ